MTYDEGLADRIREELAGEPGVTEQKMFGGVGFMVDGQMAVAASSGGDLMVRADPEAAQAWTDGDTVRQMVMRGRPMAGWLLIALDAVADDNTLHTWVGRGARCARSLPPKTH